MNWLSQLLGQQGSAGQGQQQVAAAGGGQAMQSQLLQNQQIQHSQNIFIPQGSYTTQQAMQHAYTATGQIVYLPKSELQIEEEKRSIIERFLACPVGHREALLQKLQADACLEKMYLLTGSYSFSCASVSLVDLEDAHFRSLLEPVLEDGFKE